MAIVYQIYSNGGAGGPVDYSTAVATTTGTSYTTAALAASSDYRFAVRATDSATGLSELNTQASVRLIVDSQGNDATQIPNAPFAASALPQAGGGCLVSWAYRSAGQASAPSSFLVYLTLGATPVLSTPAATVAYQAGTVGYTCRLAGLVDGAAYTVSVVAIGASASLASAAASTATKGDSTPPCDVDGLAIVVLP